MYARVIYGVMSITMQRQNRSMHSAHARQEFVLDEKKAFSWIANMYEYNGEEDPEASKPADPVQIQS